MKRDPERDCRIYHVKTRAKEIFNALDLDESGYVDEDEFISGQKIEGEINHRQHRYNQILLSKYFHSRLLAGRGVC